MNTYEIGPYTLCGDVIVLYMNNNAEDTLLKNMKAAHIQNIKQIPSSKDSNRICPGLVTVEPTSPFCTGCLEACFQCSCKLKTCQ